MGTTLAVIVGAGASHDSVVLDPAIAGYANEYRPPLVNDLFQNRDTFGSILGRYNRARSLSDDFRSRIRNGVGVEDLLDELRNDAMIRAHRWPAYHEVFLYLQELFGTIGTRFVHPGSTTRFSTFVQKLDSSRYKRILYLTLNYDLFLDNALSTHYGVQFAETKDYVRYRDSWALFKLHGSVNWGRKIIGGAALTSDGQSLLPDFRGPMNLGTIIKVLKSSEPAHRIEGNEQYFPAMALPLKDKTLVCPEEHPQIAQKLLTECEDYLFCGYSALDQDLLQLLGAAKEVKRCVVVDKEQGTRSTFYRLQTGIPAFAKFTDGSAVLYGQGFSRFVDSKEFDELCG